MAGTKRNNSYDIIRIVAIFMVVCIHANTVVINNGSFSLYWCVVCVFQPIILVAVPLFFMVSGALLLSQEKEESIPVFFKKRVAKQAIPFLVWSFVYIVARIATGKIPFGVDAFLSIIQEPAYYQFWFMYSLLAIYLILPFLQTIIRNCDKKKVEYFLIIWVIFTCLLPVLSKYIPALKTSSHADLTLCDGYIGYFVLGYYLKKYKSDVKPWKAILVWLAGVLPTIVIACMEFYHVYNTGETYIGKAYLSYMIPRFVLSATGSFLFFQNFKWKLKEKSQKYVTALSAVSIGVYYIHMLVLTVIEYAGFTGENNVVILGAKIVATYVISLIGAFVISFIPGVRKILLGAK